MSYFPPYIDETGLHMPTYEDRLQDLTEAYRTIFGLQAILDPSMPDYQLLSVFARALDDTSALVLQSYNARNPSYATGHTLDLLLPQYGLTRRPGETDAEVRRRISAGLASKGTSIPDAIYAAIMNCEYVTHANVIINDTDAAMDGIPAHSIAAVVNSGRLDDIAQAIYARKPPGISTYGTTTRAVTDDHGVSHDIHFSRPTRTSVFLQITLKTYTGFDASTVEPLMTDALLDYVNNQLAIGEDFNVPLLTGLLYQAAMPHIDTFAVTDIALSYTGGVVRDKIPAPYNVKWVLANASAVSYVLE